MDPDQDLRDKLDQLHASNREKPIDQEELESRIARLKGIDPAKYSAPPITVYRPPDKRTDVEKAEALLAQLLDENDLDWHAGRPFPPITMSRDEELEERLNKLIGVPRSSTEPLRNLAKMCADSEEEADRMVEKLLHEATLPEITGVPEVADDVPQIEVDDGNLTWCVICNEDAGLKCCDCDGDLYCFECFR